MKAIHELVACILSACVLLSLCSVALADTTYYATIIPDTTLNVRSKPVYGSEIIGRLYLGDKVTVDTTKCGYAHCNGVSCEAGEGWVSMDFLSTDEAVMLDEREKGRIVADGRVALRKSCDGERISWLHPDDVVNVVGACGEWTITDKGYVKSEFVSFGGAK